MTKDNQVYVGEMLDTARRIVAKVQGIDRARFDTDENLQLAVTYLIQCVGEAAARVSDDLRQAHPEVPWREIVGMRQKLVHDYTRVDLDRVWTVATGNVPALIKSLEQI